jgi:hypothetical protein
VATGESASLAWPPARLFQDQLNPPVAAALMTLIKIIVIKLGFRSLMPNLSASSPRRNSVELHWNCRSPSNGRVVG